MADEKQVVAEAATKPAEAKAEETKAPKAAVAKADTKKVEAKKVVFAAPTLHDYEVVKEPHITEKSMALIQNANKITVKVLESANKIEIKESFQRLYQAQVDAVKVINQRAKEKSRGGRYKGAVSGYKKAIVTLHEGSAIDLFKE
jgi:large subunit ribosomal protein L23